MHDLESDFSVFHRVDNIWDMPAPKFFRMAFRIAAYDGMLARRIEAENDQPSSRRMEKEFRRGGGGGSAPPKRAAAPAPSAGRMPRSPQFKDAREVPLAAMSLNAPGLIERVQVPKASPPG
jgi:hypothetical protein